MYLNDGRIEQSLWYSESVLSKVKVVTIRELVMYSRHALNGLLLIRAVGNLVL